MGIHRADDWRVESLVGFGFCPPTRGACRLYIETLPPLDLVELALLDWRERLGGMALCTVGLNPLPPMDDFQSQPFLYPLFALIYLQERWWRLEG